MAMTPINPYLVLDWAQNIGQQQAQVGNAIGAGVGRGIQGYRQKKAQENYDNLFQAYRDNPTQETGLALAEAAIPMGFGEETMMALQMYGGDNPDAVAYDPDLIAQYNARGETFAQTRNPQDAMAYIRAAEQVGREEEALERVKAFGFTEAELEGISPFGQARESFLNDPNPQTAEVFLNEARNQGKEGFEQAQAQIDMILSGRDAAGNQVNTGPLQEALRGLQEAKQSGDRQAITEQRANVRLVAAQYGLEETAGLVLGDVDEADAAYEQEQLENNFNQAIDTLAEDIDSEEALADAYQYAAQLGFTGTVDSVHRELKAIAQARQQQQKEQRFRDQLQVLREEPTFENFQTARDAAREIGALDFLEQEYANIDQNTADKIFNQNEAIMSPLFFGNPEAAIEATTELISALEAEDPEGNAQRIADLKEHRENIRDGKGDQVLAQIGLESSMLNSEEMRAYFERTDALTQEERARRAEEREELKLDMEITRTLSENTFESDEEREYVAEQMRGLRGAQAEQVANMFLVRPDKVSPGSRDYLDYLKHEDGLRNEYDEDVKTYQEAAENGERIRSLVESGAETGMVDNAILSLFNRVLEPDSVVRASEAARTEASQGTWDRVENFRQMLKEGTTFTPETRREMMAVVDTILEVNDKASTESRQRIDNVLSALWQDNEKELELSRERVFRNIAGQEEREQRRATGNPLGNARPAEVTAAIKRFKDTEFYRSMSPALQEEIDGYTTMEEVRRNLEGFEGFNIDEAAVPTVEAINLE
jgi:hypothetical protein